CGATINYSVPGRLLGHIAIGFSEVDRRARAIPDFPEELRLQLLHIILAHHGSSEFGSPVRPMTAEAVAVHCIENCDAQVAQFEEKIGAAVEEGREFTEYDPLLERYLYAGSRAVRDPGKRIGANGQVELF
ncbi:MAG TPA: metal-dependent phosphohydrolase, partial [Armatimonadota bacterium]|nr:metal-dependent phosphohydrolase [Armatimonadota bacterium]